MLSDFTKYIKQIWKDKPDTSSPINAIRLNHIEDGIYNNSEAVSQLDTTVSELTENMTTVKGTLSLQKRYTTQGQYIDIPLEITLTTAGRSYLIADIVGQNGSGNKIFVTFNRATQTIIGTSQVYTNDAISFTKIEKTSTGITITFKDTSIWGVAFVSCSDGIALK